MLKLERASRQEGSVHLIVRDKERLITKSLVISFLITLAIHLTLMLLFHVDLFKIESGLSVFPPIQVETHLSSKDSIIADTKQANQTIRGLPPLPSSAPASFTRPSFLPVRPTESNTAIYGRKTTFSQIEKEVYEPQFNPTERPSKMPFKIIVSGILAEYPLISNGLHDKKLPSERIETRIIYSVLVDRKSGKIFWMEQKQPVPYPQLKRFAESLLKDMKFDLKKQLTAVGGEIEFHFNLETAVQDNKMMQDFELESLRMGADHSQMVKAAPIRNDYGSKDCVNLLSSTAVSRFKLDNK